MKLRPAAGWPPPPPVSPPAAAVAMASCDWSAGAGRAVIGRLGGGSGVWNVCCLELSLSCGKLFADQDARLR